MPHDYMSRAEWTEYSQTLELQRAKASAVNNKLGVKITDNLWFIKEKKPDRPKPVSTKSGYGCARLGWKAPTTGYDACKGEQIIAAGSCLLYTSPSPRD